MNFSSHSTGFLKAERVRLGLSQAQAAEIAGVSREIWGRYERGAAAPGADVLLQLAAAEWDIGYVLLGKRSTSAPQSPAQIDVERLAKIVQMLARIAAEAGVNLPANLLVEQAAKVYNVLDEPAFDEKKAEQVLRLVVNR